MIIIPNQWPMGDLKFLVWQSTQLLKLKTISLSFRNESEPSSYNVQTMIKNWKRLLPLAEDLVVYTIKTLHRRITDRLIQVLFGWSTSRGGQKQRCAYLIMYICVCVWHDCCYSHEWLPQLMTPQSLVPRVEWLPSHWCLGMKDSQSLLLRHEWLPVMDHWCLYICRCQLRDPLSQVTALAYTCRCTGAYRFSPGVCKYLL